VASTKQIVSAVHEHKQESAKTLAEGIVASAYLAGSTDNISALVVKIK
jgi:serine/threonine protein phosphatase PrpC